MHGSEAEMIKKLAAGILILFALAVPAANASPEFWLGASLRYDMNYISSDWKKYFPAYNDGNINFINSGGLTVNFIYFYA